MDNYVDLTENRVFKDSPDNVDLKEIPWSIHDERGIGLYDIIHKDYSYQGNMLDVKRDDIVIWNPENLNVSISTNYTSYTSNSNWILDPSLGNYLPYIDNSTTNTTSPVYTIYSGSSSEYYNVGKTWRKYTSIVNPAFTFGTSVKDVLESSHDDQYDILSLLKRSPLSSIKLKGCPWISVYDYKADIFYKTYPTDDLWTDAFDIDYGEVYSSYSVAKHCNKDDSRYTKLIERLENEDIQENHAIPWRHVKGEKNPLNTWDLPDDFMDKEISMPGDSFFLHPLGNADNIQLGIN